MLKPEALPSPPFAQRMMLGSDPSQIVTCLDFMDADPLYILSIVQMYHEVSDGAACASNAIVAISGHGFLIASDSLTKHPLGPGIQPKEIISDFQLIERPRFVRQIPFSTMIPFSSSTLTTFTF